jgi:hypothetical protein
MDPKPDRAFGRSGGGKSKEDGMTEGNVTIKTEKSRKCNYAGPLYGLGFIGAAIYFIGHAASFWGGVLGFLKAIVWPVFLVYKLLEFLKM